MAITLILIIIFLWTLIALALIVDEQDKEDKAE